MLEAISHSTQTVVYLTIAFLSFVVLAISFFAGSLFGADHDVPHDHDISHDHDASADHGGEYGPTVSIFSPKIFFVFTLGFGAAGAVASMTGFGKLGSAFSGLASGLFFGAIAFYGLSMLYRQQANSVINTDNAIGKVGTVVTSISSGEIGEVEVAVSGCARTYTARAAKEGEAFIQGRSVKIVRNSGGTLLVEATS